MKIYKADGILLAEVDLDDTSYRNRAIMGDNELTLKFALAEHLELPIGSYCEFQGSRYTLMRPEALKMNHTRYFEYTATMEGEEAYAKIWKLRNTADGRLKFSMTAKPHEFVQLFVDNMNRRSGGWSLGECIEATEQLISFDHAYCYEALSQIADAFKTEFEIVGKRVSLHKVEYNKTSPLPLSYGKGNGFKSGVGRSNYSENPPAEILYVQGGEKNIDRSKYGSAELHLPKNGLISYDGEKFEDEDGFKPDNAHNYMTDADGFSIRRADKPLSSMAEASLDCSESYPKRVGIVSEVIDVKPESNFYDFTDNTIPNTLNYEDCLIDGETMTVVFQSGMLAGREFEVKYINEPRSGKKGKRFEIVPQETDGITMPNETFKPRTNDTYAVFNCMLPSSYINAYDPEDSDPKKEGAEWDMFREAVRYLYDNEEQRFTFSGTLDGIWAKKDWVNIGGRIILGGYILFTDERFAREGALVRIIGIKDYLNNPHSPEIELSNNTISAGFSTQIQKLESSEVLAEKNHRESIQYTKRRFRDAKETIGMLNTLVNEGFDNFANSINPIAVQTMQMIAGDESLQFRFVDSKTAPQEVSLSISYDQEAKRLRVPQSILQHLTLDIDTLSNEHHPSEYRFWDMQEYQSARLDDPAKKYYLYAKVGRDAENGTFLLSETVRLMESESDYYYFLVGVLNSEYEGERSFASLYGFTEILPGRITTDKVVTGDGGSYFDLLANAFKLGNKLSFNTDGTGRLILNGTLVQSQSGDVEYIGCFRGVYSATTVYFQGDEVTYTINGNTSSYRYVHSIGSAGIDPTNAAYWQVVAQGTKGKDGKDGENGQDGKDGTNGISGTNGQDGKDGKDGANGQDGDYTELRFSKNGSASTAPDLSAEQAQSPSPNGWSLTVPSVGVAEYLWMISAKKSADGNTLRSEWTAPTRLTGVIGQKGENGKSPVLTFRGVYDSAETYYGNDYRLDCVKLGGEYYIARIDAGEVIGVSPTDTSKWNPFGASFESVATQLLLAENANIGGWIFRNGRMESQTTTQDGSSPMAWLNGNTGEMRLRGTVQLSTAYQGNISDANLIYLPSLAAGTSRNLSLGCEKEDCGKVVRLYNSSPIGGGRYYIASNKFDISGVVTTVHETIYCIVDPQEIIEMTCFERTGSTAANMAYEWQMSNRNGIESFRQDGAKGRYPLMLGMGHIGSGGALSGKWHDGTELSNILSVEYSDKTASEVIENFYTYSRTITLRLNSGSMPSGYKVFATGNSAVSVGVITNDTWFKISAYTVSSGGLDTFDFVILDPNWWYQSS